MNEVDRFLTKHFGEPTNVKALILSLTITAIFMTVGFVLMYLSTLFLGDNLYGLIALVILSLISLFWVAYKADQRD